MDRLQAIEKRCQCDRSYVLLYWLFLYLITGCHAEEILDLRSQIEHLRELQYEQHNWIRNGINSAVCRNGFSDEIQNLYKNISKSMETYSGHLHMQVTTLNSNVNLINLAEMSRHSVYYNKDARDEISLSHAFRVLNDPLPFFTTLNILIVPTTKTSTSDLIEIYQEASKLRETITPVLTNGSSAREVTAIWIYQVPEEHTLFIKKYDSFGKLIGSIRTSMAETLYKGVRPIWIVRTECQIFQKNSSKRPGIDLLIRG